jgi:eukaryotic-like serine/threonine-protein kinase
MHAVMGAGRLIAGRYRLQGPIGRGAMGIVWRGRDELLHRDVAVKEVQVTALTAPAEAEVSYQRTLREARTAARLSHPSVVTIFDVVEEDGSPWIVMELIGGRSLDQVIAEDGPLPPVHAAELGTSLLGALATAHAAGVLHRDVKPGNVLITADGRTVLTDFGIATFAEDPGLTQVGLVVGTPGFTAPERVRGDGATPASDLWSLGATLYAAVEGRGPFDRAGGATAIMSGVVTEDAPRAPSAGPLGPAIGALLRRDPAARPDAAAAATLLASASAAAGGGSGPRPDGWALASSAAAGAGLGYSQPGYSEPGYSQPGYSQPEDSGPAGLAPNRQGRALPGPSLPGSARPGSAHPGAGQFGAAGLAAAGLGAAELGTAQLAAAGLGAAELGTAQLAAAARELASGAPDGSSPDAATAALPAAAGSGAQAGRAASFLDPPVYADLRMPEPADRDPAVTGAWPVEVWPGAPAGAGGAGGRGAGSGGAGSGGAGGGPGWGGSGGPGGPAGRGGPGWAGSGGPGGRGGPGEPTAGLPGFLDPPDPLAAAGRATTAWSPSPAQRRQPWSRHWRVATVGTGIAAIAVAAVLGSAIYSRSLSSGPSGDAAGGSHGTTTAGAGNAAGPSAGASVPPAAAGAGTGAGGGTGGSRAGGSGSTGTAPPPGYQWETVTAASVGATAGFVMAAPDGWQLRIQGQAAYLKAPGRAADLEVSMSPFTYHPPGREAHARQAAALAAHEYPGYRRAWIRPAEFQEAAAATWRFSWKPAGRPRTAVLMLLVTLPTSAGPQSYTLTVSAPAASFAAAKSAFGQALVTFRPFPPS